MKELGFGDGRQVCCTVVLGCARSTRSLLATKTIDVPMDDILNQSNISRDMKLIVGDTLKVTLGSNHTALYRWMANATIGDASVVKQPVTSVSDQFLA
ncbi:hypothetical protein [Mycobacterium lepromatosis]|uniref:hypothetical protein n=1 Tax=Mycobacterium lepromatosis TaxID=480418 RepID=UPI0009E2AD9A|nr:hypothetical protein [Mycobacterium lepromatosis]